MADLATLAPTGTGGRLGHFLPYLLRRRLRAVLWPADGGERTMVLLLLALMVAYGAGLGILLSHGGSGSSEESADFLPKLQVALNAAWLSSALLVDFLPALRPVTRVLPEHFPVSARWNVVSAFLLNLITLRRLLIITALVVAVVTVPHNAVVPGFSLLLMLGATVFSFNLRLLVALRRWRHPLMLAHLASLGLMLWWLAHPEASYSTPLGVAMAVLPWLLGAGQLYWLGPYFSARYLPDAEAPAAPVSGSLLARLSPEHRAYFSKVWVLLLMGLVMKVVILGITRWGMGDNEKLKGQSFFYLALVPLVGFTYTNNNLFGFMKTMAANEIQRLGLTRRMLVLYLRLVLPVVLFDCLLTAAFLLGLFPRTFWPLLGLLPLGAAALTSLGLWGSFYQARAVVKAVDFTSNRNASALMSLATIATAAALYFLPWWARIALAAVITASAWWPIRAVLRNDGRLRRRLWRGIGA
ncbi:hypothetical protein GCM10011495_28270 [Hymenobacter frigidus]|uniref:Polysaccharide biosynthesis protein C-terminal domain-containing protein n=1 Tax=Hymenobacter frigidus TaxID=1524095 RepID=A0ABQ2ABN9_9BACT|nr:hypothetical protein [Hymenobacter frigidus]GGH88013.1 hypothetical protein GCM10011495_28270 [Hymenobacter frigidus]